MRKISIVLALAACVILAGGSYHLSQARGLQQTAPTLGTASSFAVLGGQSVTNTGPTVVNGDLGVSPGTAVTGFPPGTVVNGTIHAADAVAAQAQADNTAAYNNLAGQPCDVELTGQDLGGQTLTTGVYCFASSAQLTGTLTLDAQGDPNAVFVFQIGSTLTTASNSSVVLINGASPCNVFFQVGSSATLGTNTTFEGNILALTSISLNTGASVSARALAQNGSVTLDTNTIGQAGCATGGTDTGDDVGADTGTDTGDDVGADTGTDTGDDVGADTGADTGDDVGTDTGDDVGTDAGADAGDDVGTDAGADAGDDVGADAGADAGDDVGTDAGDDDGELPQPPKTGAGGGMASGGTFVGASVAALVAALALRRRK
jgi:hypothetical protein